MKRGRFLLGAALRPHGRSEHGSRARRALAQTPLPGLPGGDDRVLVVINLQGGNDGLNTVVPHGKPHYYQMRPTLAVPQNDVLAIDNDSGSTRR